MSLPRALWTSMLVLWILGATSAHAVEPDPHLAPLAPFVGKTWRGEFVQADSGQPAVDVARWEWALNGKAVRILHSIDDGAYGGESLVLWDPEDERIVYFYFTTEGFYTTGTMAIADGVFTSHEIVSGNTEGVTEVRASGELLEDGRWHARSEYLKDGAWTPGHEAYYVEDPTAVVRFREVD